MSFNFISTPPIGLSDGIVGTAEPAKATSYTGKFSKGRKGGTMASSNPALLFDNKKSLDSGPIAELLTIADVANLLKISASSVRRLQQQRRIPFIKVGGSVRFASNDLVSFLAVHRVEPIG